MKRFLNNGRSIIIKGLFHVYYLPISSSRDGDNARRAEFNQASLTVKMRSCPRLSFSSPLNAVCANNNNNTPYKQKASILHSVSFEPKSYLGPTPGRRRVKTATALGEIYDIHPFFLAGLRYRWQYYVKEQSTNAALWRRSPQQQFFVRASLCCSHGRQPRCSKRSSARPFYPRERVSLSPSSFFQPFAFPRTARRHENVSPTRYVALHGAARVLRWELLLGNKGLYIGDCHGVCLLFSDSCCSLRCFCLLGLVQIYRVIFGVFFSDWILIR